MRILLVLAACASLMMGQSATEDREKAVDYPVSASVGGVDIGAEFLVHSIPASRGYYYAKGYMVVDIGVFPKTGRVLKFSALQFTLRLNGGSVPLIAQSPGMVATSLKYPDWAGEPTGFSGSASAGGIGIDSRTHPLGRYPDDPRGPDPDNGTVNPNQDDAPDHQLSLVALPDAATDRPLRGCVFFASDIKVKKIKLLELEWTGPAGEHAVLRLR